MKSGINNVKTATTCMFFPKVDLDNNQDLLMFTVVNKEAELASRL
jgi:hypothetical protein